MTNFIIVSSIFLFGYLVYGKKNVKIYILSAICVSFGMPMDYEILQAYTTPWCSGIYISLSDILIVILLVTQIGKVSPHKRELGEMGRSVLKFIIIFMIAGVISMIKSTALPASVYALFDLAKLFIFYFCIVTCLIDDEQDLRLLSTVLLVTLLFQGSCGVIGYLFQINTTINTGRVLDVYAVPDDGEIRAGGTLGRPNAYGMILASLCSFAFCLRFGPSGLRTIRLMTASLLFGSIGLILSFSRGGWLSLAICLVIFHICGIKRGFLRLRDLAVPLLMIAVMGIVFYPKIQQRITGDDKSSASTRIELARIAVNMIEDNWILGVGINNYYEQIRKYKPNDYSGGYTHVVHNQFLLIWAESGIIGLFGFVAMLIAVVRSGVKTFRYRTRSISIISLGLLLAFISTIIHMNVEYVTSRNLLGYILFIMAMIVSCDKIVCREQMNQTKEFLYGSQSA